MLGVHGGTCAALTRRGHTAQWLAAQHRQALVTEANVRCARKVKRSAAAAVKAPVAEALAATRITPGERPRDAAWRAMRLVFGACDDDGSDDEAGDGSGGDGGDGRASGGGSGSSAGTSGSHSGDASVGGNARSGNTGGGGAGGGGDDDGGGGSGVPVVRHVVRLSLHRDRQVMELQKSVHITPCTVCCRSARRSVTSL